MLRVPVRSAKGGRTANHGHGDLHGACPGSNDPRTRVDGERLGDVPPRPPKWLVEGDGARLDHLGRGGERVNERFSFRVV